MVWMLTQHSYCFLSQHWHKQPTVHSLWSHCCLHLGNRRDYCWLGRGRGPSLHGSHMMQCQMPPNVSSLSAAPPLESRPLGVVWPWRNSRRVEVSVTGPEHLLQFPFPSCSYSSRTNQLQHFLHPFHLICTLTSPSMCTEPCSEWLIPSYFTSITP